MVYSIGEAESFTELYVLIRKLGGVQGSREYYDASTLIRRLEAYRKSDGDEAERLRHITRGRELRSTAKRVKDNSVDERFLDMLQTNAEAFLPFFNDKRSSGWKLHVYGESWVDSLLLVEHLHRVLDDFDVGYKAATKKFYENVSSSHKQHGKAMTIYIPVNVILREQVNGLVTAVVQTLRDEEYEKSGSITGDKSITGSVHYRYAYEIPTPVFGIPRGKDGDYRRSNNGSYNIQDNPDLIQLSLNGNSSLTAALQAINNAA